jgi:hypothetical protein
MEAIVPSSQARRSVLNAGSWSFAGAVLVWVLPDSSWFMVFLSAICFSAHGRSAGLQHDSGHGEVQSREALLGCFL